MYKYLESLYWQITAPWDISITDWLIFNNYWLSNSNILVEKFNPYDTWEAVYKDYDLPLQNWKWFISKYWRSRQLSIDLLINTNNNIELESIIDEIKKNIDKNKGILKYKLWNWQYRQILATCTNITFKKEHYNINWLPLTINLITNEPFFSDVTLEQKSFNWITWNLQDQIINNWNKESFPKIFIIFWTSNVTNITITINNKILTIPWIFITNDILSIDSFLKTIKLNWVIHSSSGWFPFLESWLNTITINFTGSVNCDVVALFKNNYL